MIGKLKITIFSSLLFSHSIQAKSSFNCVFEKHYSVHLSEEKTEEYAKGATRLSFENNKTTKETMSLDGSIRATNSKKWRLVKSDNLGANYIGSNGDLLSILYKPENGRGTFQAVLQWVSFGYAFTSMGSCNGEP